MNEKSIGIIAPSTPLKSYLEVEPAIKYLQKYQLNTRFFTNDDKLESFYAAQNSDVDLLMAVRGGFNCVELLPKIDFSVVKKALCGYSDITVLLNALLAKTENVQFLGPNLKAFNSDVAEYGINNFLQTVWQKNTIKYVPSQKWKDTHISETDVYDNSGVKVINSGCAEGYLVGGNLCSQLMMCGTEFYPIFENMIIVAEEDDLCGEYTENMFLRNLWALFQHKFSANIKGLIIGRFMQNSNVSMPHFLQKLKELEPLNKIPVIADFDTGHTMPIMTLPIGKKAVLDTADKYMLRF